jgi:hypothetical protein
VIPLCKKYYKLKKKNSIYTEVDVVEDGSQNREDQVWVGLVEIFEPPYPRSCQIIIFIRDLPDAEHHDNEDWDLNDVVKVESQKVGIGLLRIIIDSRGRVPESRPQRHIRVFE